MGVADCLRVMRGHLTPGEIADRDAAAMARMAASGHAGMACGKKEERDGRAEHPIESAQQTDEAPAGPAQPAKVEVAADQPTRSQPYEYWQEMEKHLQQVRLRTLKAAGVGNATLVCHRHLLTFITTRLGPTLGWHDPTGSEEPDRDLVRVTLSGPQLACIVAYMADLGHIPGNALLVGGTDAEKAMARRLYEGIGLVVDGTRIDPDGENPEILIDDRLPGTTSDR